ncbi:MAG: N-acetylneuraminate synthase family protein [Gammaproteobacteria bacterium]|nr:N-acetylneuraminate synthase family protein [Gammaproteobacteria bacterium]
MTTKNNIFQYLKDNNDAVYLIAEIGINHNGDMSIAKKLIDASHACGWDCVKFQKRNPDVCVPEDQKLIKRDTPWGEMTYIDYKYKVEFEEKEYNEIDKYCKEKPILWTTSVWDLDSLAFMEQYDVPFLKIPSAHLTNLELIEETAKTGIPIIVSSGMSDWKMIENAIKVLEKNNAEYSLLHCNSTYPAPHDELNLNVIVEMQKRYDCIIGYSGHEYDLTPSQVAVTLGARIIERHITINHNMWGTDQSASLEVNAMDLLNKRLVDIRSMMGVSEKFITESEKEVIKKLRG